MMPAYGDDGSAWGRLTGNGEAYLDDEDVNGVLGVVSGGIRSLEDTSLTGCSDHHDDSRLRQL